jgi:aldose 1-epimerase
MTDPQPACVRLVAGDAVVEIAPSVGGAIASFTLAGADVLRPTPHDARAEGNVRAFACYPLVPYSNRIANARLAFDGREHALVRNFGDSPHAIHGVGWQRAWSVVSSSDSGVQLALDHDALGDTATSWPWPFRVLQTFALERSTRGSTLSARLAIENTGRHAFPFGLGWHPFFPKPPGTTIAFAATHVWKSDTTQIPVARVAVPDAWRFDPPRPLGDVELDHVFEPSTGAATIRWPARALAVAIDADRALDRRVVFVPPGRDYLAFEPVTHMTDAFNRAERGERGTGTRLLPPGASFSCTMRLQTSADA